MGTLRGCYRRVNHVKRVTAGLERSGANPQTKVGAAKRSSWTWAADRVEGS